MTWPAKHECAFTRSKCRTMTPTQVTSRERLAQYRRGDFGFCGVRAVAEIEFPSSDGWVIVGRLESPGVWGIEDDSVRDYLAEVFEAEKAILLELFASLREFELVS